MKGAIAMIIALVTFSGIGVSGRQVHLIHFKNEFQKTFIGETECFKRLSAETFIFKETKLPGRLLITGFARIGSFTKWCFQKQQGGKFRAKMFLQNILGHGP